MRQVAAQFTAIHALHRFTKVQNVTFHALRTKRIQNIVQQTGANRYCHSKNYFKSKSELRETKNHDN